MRVLFRASLGLRLASRVVRLHGVEEGQRMF